MCAGVAVRTKCFEGVRERMRERETEDRTSGVDLFSSFSVFFSFSSILRPEIRRDYPLNLSILISGGKETNQDSLSNGE